MAEGAGTTGSSGSEASQEADMKGGATIPIRCVLEQPSESATSRTGNTSPSPEATKGVTKHQRIRESYAVIKSCTPWPQIVTAAAHEAFSDVNTVGATGFVQVGNWRCLPLDEIIKERGQTAADLFSPVVQAATLHIRIPRRAGPASGDVGDQIKDLLLKLLLSNSRGYLSESGCPIPKEDLEKLTRGEDLPDLPLSTRQEFQLWYTRYVASAAASDADYKALSPDLGSRASLAPGRTRIRTSFDPDVEIPLLQRWFHLNQHPTREQMQGYLSDLNSLTSRKNKRALDLTNIIYWFKNARAALRRSSKNGGRNNSLNGYATPPGVAGGPMAVFPERLLVPSKMEESSEDDMEEEEEGRDEIGEIKSEQEVDIKPELTSSESSEKGSEKTEERRGRKEGEVLENEPQDLSVGSRRHSQASSSDKGEEESEGGEGRFSSSHQHFPLPWSSAPIHGQGGLVSPAFMPGLPGFHMGALLPAYLQAAAYAQATQQHGGTVGGLHTPHHGRLPVDTPSSSPHDDLMKPNMTADGKLGDSDRKKRTRVFIDPLSEIPKLEKWFLEDTHPTACQIEKYTDMLNKSDYRMRFPKLESKNVQLWFKNHRAKVKRMKLSPHELIM